jgi:hypothetical protein
MFSCTKYKIKYNSHCKRNVPKFETNIPRNETARPRSQFYIHVSVSDSYIGKPTQHLYRGAVCWYQSTRTGLSSPDEYQMQLLLSFF